MVDLFVFDTYFSCGWEVSVVDTPVYEQSSFAYRDLSCTVTLFTVPQLLKRAGRISISSDDYGLRSVQCDSPLSFHAPEKDSELHDASITSIMVVLMPSGAGTWGAVTIIYCSIFIEDVLRTWHQRHFVIVCFLLFLTKRTLSEISQNRQISLFTVQVTAIVIIYLINAIIYT